MFQYACALSKSTLYHPLTPSLLASNACQKRAPLTYGGEAFVNTLVKLDIDIPRFERVLNDEVLARLDGIAHEHREDLIGIDRIFNTHLQ